MGSRLGIYDLHNAREGNSRNSAGNSIHKGTKLRACKNSSTGSDETLATFTVSSLIVERNAAIEVVGSSNMSVFGMLLAALEAI